MNKTHIIFVLILLFVSCGLVYMAKEHFDSKKERLFYFRLNDNVDYKQNSQDLMQAMQDIAGEANLEKADAYYKTEFLLFETLNFIDQTIGTIGYPRDLKYIYGVRGTDMMASKSNLAIVLKSVYKQADIDMIPKTYILEDNKDTQLMVKEYNPNWVYITKKNLQRQEGNTLTNNLEKMVSSSKEIVVAQVVLQDPYLVNGRKINMRVYMLVSVTNDNKTMIHIYNDGIIYYTPKKFKAYSLEPDEVITTGYIDRNIYLANPMTFEDLKVHMVRQGDNYDIVWSNIIELMKKVSTAYVPILKEVNKGIPGLKFLVYGCDIAPDTKLNVKLMEINKGPDLTYKDERDKKVKLNMVREMFGIIGILKRNTNNFTLVSE